ncbi:hypothetical protein [Neisseria sp. P0019.S002]
MSHLVWCCLLFFWLVLWCLCCCLGGRLVCFGGLVGCVLESCFAFF